MENFSRSTCNTHKDDPQESNKSPFSDKISDGNVFFMNTLYSEYRKCLDPRNSCKVDKILSNIIRTFPDNLFMNVVKAHLCLLHGDIIESHRYLYRFSQEAKRMDYLALNVIAMWNDTVGYNSIALLQYSECLNYNSSQKFAIPVLINLAAVKKRLNFYDKALSYLERILAIPEGYKSIIYIKLHVIHILILKEHFDEAFDEIHSYLMFKNNMFIQRLRIYVFYRLKNTKELLKYNNEAKDPYVLYILARAGIDNANLPINVGNCLEEAIKACGNNEFFYNTCGNYYSKIGNYPEAIEQYKIALKIRPKFSIAMENLDLVTRMNNRNEMNSSHEDEELLLKNLDVNPDVEELGFFRTWELMGFKPLQKDYNFISRVAPLRLFYIND